MLLKCFRSIQQIDYIPQHFKLGCFCKSVIFEFSFSFFFQMLRVQKVYGKNKEGSSVPLCIKLQGAVLCGKPQHQNIETGFTCPTDNLERSDAQEKHLCSPFTETDASHCEHSTQPHGKELFPGKFVIRLSWHLCVGHEGIKTFYVEISCPTHLNILQSPDFIRGICSG